MWFFNRQKNIIGIELDSNSITLSVISSHLDNQADIANIPADTRADCRVNISEDSRVDTQVAIQANIYHLEAYCQYPLTQTEIYDALIFNSSYIHKIISQFIRDNKLKNISAVISLSHALITEIITPETSPTIPKELACYAWHAFPLQLSSQQYTYIAALRHELFFQLQLLLHTSAIKISTLTTENMVLYNLFHQFCNPLPPLPQLSIEEPMVSDITIPAMRDFMHTKLSNCQLIENFILRTSNRFHCLDREQIMQLLGLYIVGAHETI